ncbi:MAG TPA: hypothetical protein VIS07_07990 [Candidatus Binatia bacterium]
MRLLAEHFLEQHARRVGKVFHGIRRESLALLESYSWPGNVRELQNVIGRSVILSEPGELARPVVARARRRADAATARRPRRDAGRAGARDDRAALAESGGRISGPRGAAARLGMPPSTLDSRIRARGIVKERFRTPSPLGL